MNQPGRIGLRSLFALTAIAAVFLGAMAVPSPRWVPLLTILTMSVVAYGIQRATASPACRPFWFSYFGGLLLLSIALVGYQYSMMGDPYRDYIAAPIWRLFHGQIDGSDSYRYEVFMHFAFYLRLIFAVTLPMVIAFAMTFLSRDRNAQSA